MVAPLAVALAVAAPAVGAAEPAAPPGLPLDDLRAAASAQSPEAADAVERLLAGSGSVDPFAPPPKNVPQPFMPAPTVGPGCGGGVVPYAQTTAWVHPGPHDSVPLGSIQVFVDRTIDVPIADSSMTLVWLNVENLRGGIGTLDAAGPHLTATVDSGPGAVMAAVFGSIRYANGAFCQVVYTMGGFFA
ncbi:hypothetical protein HCA44_18355 [Rhodococcus sp. HNM0569]|nr:hypothetical protein [Rhodococcus sp. HNM0569]